jgi:histidine phosphotransferase ChpT
MIRPAFGFVAGCTVSPSTLPLAASLLTDTPMSDKPISVFALDALDLAALLCSRVCHDVISPVGAIVNGLEVLEDEKDADMRNFALDLIKKSARTASARLQFCRLAFGAAGSAGASIDTGDAEQVARNLLTDDRTKLEWNAPRVLMPKNKVKLVLNLCLIAGAAIPRGGVISVTITGGEIETTIEVGATGSHVRMAQTVPGLIAGTPENDAVDAHGIQAFYTGLVARECGMDISVAVEPDNVRICARPPATEVAEAAA